MRLPWPGDPTVLRPSVADPTISVNAPLSRITPDRAMKPVVVVILVSSVVVAALGQLVPQIQRLPPPTATPQRTVAPVDPAAIAKLERLGKRPIRVHDPSTIVRCKDEYWLFYTGLGAPSFHSRDLQTWVAGPPVFTNAPEWTLAAVPAKGRNYSYWAPDVMEVNGRYLLYYSVSTFGKNTSAIGLAINSTLDPTDAAFRWEDAGLVIRSSTTNSYNTIDPAITRDFQGGLWLAFGSYWRGIKLLQLDPATGKRISPEAPLYSLAYHESIEAAFLYPHDGHYYLFVNWGACCRGVNSTYNIRVGRAMKITGPYLDREGRDMLAGGGSLFLESDGPFIGPGHAGILKDGERYWLSVHFYDATQRGQSELAVRPLTWRADGWPEVE